MTHANTLPDAPRMALYHYEGCFYCYQVRQKLERLGLEIELRNIFEDQAHMRDLVQARGRRTVPVLRIAGEGGQDRWLPESRDIIEYLDELYG